MSSPKPTEVQLSRTCPAPYKGSQPSCQGYFTADRNMTHSPCPIASRTPDGQSFLTLQLVEAGIENLRIHLKNTDKGVLIIPQPNSIGLIFCHGFMLHSWNCVICTSSCVSSFFFFLKQASGIVHVMKQPFRAPLAARGTQARATVATY